MKGGAEKKGRTRREYFWICAIEKISGRPLVHGPHESEIGAREWGFGHIKDGDFEVFSFPTVNKMAARDYFKSIMLERTNRLSSVFKRAKYL